MNLPGNLDATSNTAWKGRPSGGSQVKVVYFLAEKLGRPNQVQSTHCCEKTFIYSTEA